jgi:hypothetical protein
MKRMSQREIEDLGSASQKLAQVAETIRLTKANYAPSCIQLLIEANDIIVGIRDRALATVTRVIEQHEDQLDEEARERARAADAAPAGWPGGGEKPQE